MVIQELKNFIPEFVDEEYPKRRRDNRVVTRSQAMVTLSLFYAWLLKNKMGLDKEEHEGKQSIC